MSTQQSRCPASQECRWLRAVLQSTSLYVSVKPWLSGCRYFLRKLRKVKKANGQILACNEVCLQCASWSSSACFYMCTTVCASAGHQAEGTKHTELLLWSTQVQG